MLKVHRCYLLSRLNDVVIKRRYQIYCARRVSGITFITYNQDRTIEMPNNLRYEYFNSRDKKM